MKSLLHSLCGVALFLGSHSNIYAAAAAESSSRADGSVVTPPKERFHIYLLMGQSNMAGRDTRKLDSQVANPRLLALTPDGQWRVAKDPIHQKEGRTEPGAGPGIPFALEMLKLDSKITIGLVPCAVGGSPLKRWVKGGDLYQRALERAKLASGTGTISGVLWHQGETDSDKQPWAERYEKSLSRMFVDLCHDLGQPRLPIVVGQLGEFLEKEKHPHVETVRDAIKKVSQELENVGYAASSGLGHKGDQLHFDAAASQELGKRFARAMAELHQAPGLLQQAATGAYDVWPEGKMPGKGAREPEGPKSPERTDAIRITNVSRPTLTVFPAAKKDSPAMIVCPGGGYSYVVMDKEGTEIAAWLNAQGIGALVLKYRTPNNRDGALQDAQRAISLARSRAAEWNIDPKRLGIIGFSAGGHLAAKTSMLFDQRAYPSIDAVDQQSCRPDFAVLVYPAYLDDRNGGLSPDLNLKANIPPTLIVHSGDDQKFILGSTLYDAALTKAEVPRKFLLYPTGGHGYGLRSTREAQAWPDAAAEWLRRIEK